jgi:hypothetical protein
LFGEAILSHRYQRRYHVKTVFSRHFVEGNKRKDRIDGKKWKKIEQLLFDLKEKRSYWKLKGEATGRVALPGKRVTKDAMDVSQDKLMFKMRY